jgi:hypothetical protein
LMGLNGRRSSKFVLSRMRCLLHWKAGQPIRTLRASFADYLTDPRRCGNCPWIIVPSAVHYTLARGCMRLLKIGLRFNICGLETSHVRNEGIPGLDSRVMAVIPDYLKYACHFWADHLQSAYSGDGLWDDVKDFMYSRFLYWLEALSLTGGVISASPALLKTARWITVGCSTSRGWIG